MFMHLKEKCKKYSFSKNAFKFVKTPFENDQLA